MANFLIIDDTDGAIDDVADKLRQLGHEVDVQWPRRALDGDIASGGVDAILLNMGMREMTGWQVLTLMKIRYPEIPVGFIFNQSADLYDERLQLVDTIISRRELNLPEINEMTRLLLRRWGRNGSHKEPAVIGDTILEPSGDGEVVR